MRIEEIIGVGKTQPKPQAKTDWKTNKTRLMGKEHLIDVEKTVKPVSSNKQR